MINKKQQLANALNNELKRLKVSKGELAKLCNVQPSIVTRWLSGKHNFTLRTICLIEEKLGIELIKLEKMYEFKNDSKYSIPPIFLTFSA